MSDHRIIFGDAAEVLRTLSEESVDCVFTSPPYWNLRDYGAEGQIGLEATPEEYVARLVGVFAEVRRVLKPAGTMALVLGDCYALSGPSALVEAGVVVNRRPKSGLKPKDMVGVPWRVAFGLQDDGWWLRNDIIWQKLNPLPESVTDRFAATHEHVFLLSRSARYWFDLNAVRVQHRSDHAPGNQSRLYVQRSRIPERLRPDQAHSFHPLGKNPGDVVALPAQPTPFAHSATFPVALVLRILPALCPPRVCPQCGQAWQHVVAKTAEPAVTHKGSRFDLGKTGARDGGDRTQVGERFGKRDLGYFPDCIHYGMDNPVLQVQTLLRQAQRGVDVTAELAECVALRDAIPVDCWQPGTVLDPFLGSGTTTEAARRLGVNSVGIELNADYEKVMRQRLGQLHTLEGSVRFETASIVKEES